MNLALAPSPASATMARVLVAAHVDLTAAASTSLQAPDDRHDVLGRVQGSAAGIDGALAGAKALGGDVVRSATAATGSLRSAAEYVAQVGTRTGAEADAQSAIGDALRHVDAGLAALGIDPAGIIYDAS